MLILFSLISLCLTYRSPQSQSRLLGFRHMTCSLSYFPLTFHYPYSFSNAQTSQMQIESWWFSKWAGSLSCCLLAMESRLTMCKPSYYTANNPVTVSSRRSRAERTFHLLEVGCRECSLQKWQLWLLRLFSYQNIEEYTLVFKWLCVFI